MTDKPYRCYFLKDNHIIAVEQLDCADDAAALLRAWAILKVSEFLSIEVWQGRRLVGQLSQEQKFAQHKQAS